MHSYTPVITQSPNHPITHPRTPYILGAVGPSINICSVHNEPAGNISPRFGYSGHFVQQGAVSSVVSHIGIGSVQQQTLHIIDIHLRELVQGTHHLVERSGQRRWVVLKEVLDLAFQDLVGGQVLVLQLLFRDRVFVVRLQVIRYGATLVVVSCNTGEHEYVHTAKALGHMPPDAAMAGSSMGAFVNGHTNSLGMFSLEMGKYSFFSGLHT